MRAADVDHVRLLVIASEEPVGPLPGCWPIWRPARRGRSVAVPVDWPHLVVAARQVGPNASGLVRSEAAASTKEWTLPIVYVWPDEFDIQVLFAGARGPSRRSRPRRHQPPADAFA
jgi:hypothetical protein